MPDTKNTHYLVSSSSYNTYYSTNSKTLMKALTFQDTTNIENSSSADEVLVIGRKCILKGLSTAPTFTPLEDLIKGPFDRMLNSISDSGKASTYLSTKYSIIALPDEVSRHNHKMSLHKLTEFVAGSKGNVQIFVIDDEIEKQVGGVSCSIARAFPLYSKKSSAKGEAENNDVNTVFLNQNFEPVQKPELWKAVHAAAEGVQLAAKLTDMPPNELTTDAYAAECRRIAEELGDCVTIEEIKGDELKERGYGGVYGVGKCAVCPPRVVIMNYTPPGESKEYVALVGKGIVYDTGGLALKTKTGMPGMKHDMAGSSGLLGGFVAAVKVKVPRRITLILAIAENAIGPNALRNDDVITLYSGKTVEINNTDAEGRLVLGDCVAHASKHLESLDLILDMATLTGAQSITTGKKHGAILTKKQSTEDRIYQAGKTSGDLVFPLLYAPELLKPEFSSKVADMKNSVANRSNAQSSCAGHFIESHIDETFEGEWVHVDMAGPGSDKDRGTGFGVGLVLGVLEAEGFM